jgi:hypothetical protein
MWKTHDRALAQLGDDPCWYPGTIRHIDGERYYVILDNREDGWATAEQLRELAVRPGDAVFVRVPGYDYYAPGKVLIQDGERLHVRFADGEEWATLDRVRFEREGALAPARRKATAQAAQAPEAWAPGDRVLARWQPDLYWYPGTVLSVEDGGRYHILFDDQDQAVVEPDEVAPLQVAVGDRIFCRPKFERRLVYYPAEVTRVVGETIDVLFDAGEEERNTTVSRVRLKRSSGLVADCAEGDRVLGDGRDGYWYPATVLVVDDDRVAVQFLEGPDAWLPADRVRRFEIAVGDHVECRWKGGPTWFSGEITRKEGDRIHINYDDGDREWTTVRLVRVEG